MPTIFYKTFPATLPPSMYPTNNKATTVVASTATQKNERHQEEGGSSLTAMASLYASPATSMVEQSAPPPPSHHHQQHHHHHDDHRDHHHHHKRSVSLGSFALEASLSSATSASSSPCSCSSSSRPSKLHKAMMNMNGDNDDTDSEDVADDDDVDDWVVPVSSKAGRTKSSVQDAIRPIASKIQMGFQRIDRKNPISLASAEATLTHIAPSTKALEAVVKATLYKPHAANYTHGSGSPEARRAIAMHHSSPEYQLSPEHVVVTNGCSGALDLALASLLDHGTTLLVPCPGFPLYQELAEAHGANVVQYRLDPNKRWECDMTHLEEIMTTNNQVRALVINNPSSPTGSVFSERHLEELLAFALRHRLPIVSDEVYGSLTFGDNKFHPMAQIAARHGRQVPILTTSGLSKQFLVPGWRVGWLTFQDNVRGSLHQVELGAHRLSQLQHGVSHLAQAAIPTLLSASTPGLAAWKESFRSTLERQGMLLCSSLNDAYCLRVAPPQGAMYAIVHIRFDRLNSTIHNDMDFAMKLVEEENVFVLPGSTFGVPGSFRVAHSASNETLEEAATRISNFCRRHAKNTAYAGSCSRRGGN